jgi:hypothetical protein
MEIKKVVFSKNKFLLLFCPVYDPFGVHSRTPKILPAKPKESGTIPTSVVGNR